MKQLLISIRIVFVTIGNAATFVPIALAQRIPLHRWPYAWRHVKARHEQEIGRLLTELTMSGEVKRRIVDGEFVYYPPDEEE